MKSYEKARMMKSVTQTCVCPTRRLGCSIPRCHILYGVDNSEKSVFNITNFIHLFLLFRTSNIKKGRLFWSFDRKPVFKKKKEEATKEGINVFIACSCLPSLSIVSTFLIFIKCPAMCRDTYFYPLTEHNAYKPIIFIYLFV